MQWRRLTRPLRDGWIVPVLEGLRRICGLLPEGCLTVLARTAAATAPLVARTHYQRAVEHLYLAGLAENPAAARPIAREMFFHLTLNVLEWMRSTHWTPEQLAGRVRIAEPERFAHWRDQQFIFLTGHVGNWELIPRAWLAHGGQAGAIVMTAQRNERLNSWIVRTRELGGHRIVFDRDSLVGLVRMLRSGRSAAMLADQDSNRWPGVFVPFFGRPAYTAEGPARLALRCRVPLVVCTLQRDQTNPWRHALHIGEPIHPDPEAHETAEIERLTAAYTAELEQRIRQAPAQWVWVHRRWHHKPGKKIKLRKVRTRKFPTPTGH